MDLNNLVQGLSKSGAVSGFAGGLAGSALAGAFAGKKGKKFAKGALKVGALAAVGGLAYTAYQRYQQGQQGQQQASNGWPPPQPSQWMPIEQERFEAAADETQNSFGALLLVRAMITAAHADGHLDGDEQQRIFAESDRLELAPAEKVLLFDELRKPLRMAEIAALVDSPEAAVEVYAASLIAIDETRPDGRGYLRQLASALELPDRLVASIHAQAELARQEDVQAA